MKEIPGQLSLFAEPELTAAQYVAVTASPYWKTSWEKIRAVQDEDIDVITQTVKDEFCPYEYAGHYGSDGRYIGYTMKRRRIEVLFPNSEVREKVTWEDFAREVIDLIWRGERGDEE